jgi:hypothetical protein
MRRHHGLCLLKLGYAHQAMGDYPAAADYLTESMAIFSQLELTHFVERAQQALETCQTHRYPAQSSGA